MLCHQEIMPATQALERYIYWPTMRGDIEPYVRGYVTRQKVEYIRNKTSKLPPPPDALGSTLPWTLLRIFKGHNMETIQYG